jgi:hypothetical protein
MAGAVTIGRLTNGYCVGDRIDALVGRMPMQTNATPGGELSRFPMVVQLTWRNDAEQSTTLQLDDRRSVGEV